MWYLYIYPYINLLSVVLFFLSNGFISAGNKEPFGIIFLCIIIVLYLMALIISCTTKKLSTKKAAIIKLVHILYYLFAFIIAVIMFLSVMGIPVTIAFIMGDLLAIIPSGIYMARTDCKIWQKFGGFIYVLDVIIAIMLLKQNKNLI